MASSGTGSSRKTSSQGNARRSGSAASSRGRSSGSSGAKKGASASRRTAAENKSRPAASSRSSARGRVMNIDDRSDLHEDLILILLLAGMAFVFLSNFGILGIVGKTVSSVMFGLFGFPAWIMPFFVFFAFAFYYSNRGSMKAQRRLISAVILLVCFGIICELISGNLSDHPLYSVKDIYSRCSETRLGGGAIAGSLCFLLYHFMKQVGTILVVIVIVLLCVIVLTDQSLVELIRDKSEDLRESTLARREARDYYRSYYGGEEEEEEEPDPEEEMARRQERARLSYEERMARREALRQREEEEEARRLEERDRRIRQREEQRRLRAEEQARREEERRLAIEERDRIAREKEEQRLAEAQRIREEREERENEEVLQKVPVYSGSLEATTIVPPGTADQESTEQPAPYPEEDYAEYYGEDSSADGAGEAGTADGSDSETVQDYGMAASATGDMPSGTEETGTDSRPGRLYSIGGDLHEITVDSADYRSISVIADASRPDPEEQRYSGIGIPMPAQSSPNFTSDEFAERIFRESVRGTLEHDQQVNVEPLPVHAANEAIHVTGPAKEHPSLNTGGMDPVMSAARTDTLSAASVRPDEAAEKNDIPLQPEESGSSFRSANVIPFPGRRTPVRYSAELTEILPEDPGMESSTPDPGMEEADFFGGGTAEEIIPAGDVLSAGDVFSAEEELPPEEEYVPVSVPEETVPRTPRTGYGEGFTPEMPSEPSPSEGSPEEEIRPAMDKSAARPEAPAPAASHTVRTEILPGSLFAVNPLSAAPAGETAADTADNHAEEAAEIIVDREQKEDYVAPISGTVAVTVKEPEKPKVKPYIYPTLDLLTPGEPVNNAESDKELQETAYRLQTTLKTFGVDVTIPQVSQGPAVTRYELLPAQGVKVSKIVALQDDIKLNLAATDIRIEAPIPGKQAIGIEVPNRKVSTVALRDLLSSPEFIDSKARIAFAVGKDIGGNTIVTDITKMPHMLIAGSTGSGKSVCINTLIMSILYRCDPEDVRMIMIDPKVVELSVYNDIPHLLLPVVTDPKKAASALQWAVAEMSDRYRRFADAQVRDLKGYNEKARTGKDPDMTVIPQIVIIVDELADLMMVSANEVEEAICRLAQLARAAGIHLIIATQRPSVDVITGLIKANMPSRVAFAVSSGVDSRTILDMNGAEKLLGKGDMLFYPQGYPKPARIQGAFVSDEDVADVVSFIKMNNPLPDGHDELRKKIDSMAAGGQGAGIADSLGGGSDNDEYFVEAGYALIEKDKASIGMLQRLFKIGFNRAARIMDQLCDAGVVSEEEGTKPRRILMSKSDFEAYIEENNI